MDFSEAFRQTVGGRGAVGVFGGLVGLLGLVWVAFCAGMVVGWAWRPRWANLDASSKSRSCGNATATYHPSSLSPLPLSPKKPFGSAPCLFSLNYQQPRSVADEREAAQVPQDELELMPVAAPATKDAPNGQQETREDMCRAVTDEDLKHLHDLVEMRDGGPPWIRMMDTSTADMRYQAWRRDPKTGPPQYCSKTVYENVTPELVRDFFWDDEFRLKWDDMLTYAAILEECATTGAMVVHWIRKFPFFCSDREYVIARRIWAAGDAYYCVTKGVPDAPVLKSDRPRPKRVDLYYSSWCIRPAASRSGNNGELTATEVILFHHEDMGIPWEIAKLGVKQGMWGTVKKIQRGIRAYQRERSSAEDAQVSRYALMARINTKVDLDTLRAFRDSDDVSEDKRMPAAVEKAPGTSIIPKLLIFGGAILIACSLDKALLAKAVIFGFGRKFAKISRRSEYIHRLHR